MSNPLIETATPFTQDGLSRNMADFKKYMEAQYKIHVAGLKKLNRNTESFNREQRRLLEDFADEFKKAFSEVEGSAREFADYQKKMMQELSAAHSKVDLTGGYLSKLESTMEAARGLYSEEIRAVMDSYKEKMKEAEHYRSWYYDSLDDMQIYEAQWWKEKDLQSSQYYADQYAYARESAETQKKRMEEVTEGAKQEVADRLKTYKKEAEAVAELNKLFNERGGKNPLADASENIATATDMMTGGLGDFLSKLKSRDLKGIGESLGKAGGFGRALEGRATQEGAGGGAKFFGMIGKVLKGMGPMLRLVGALAKGFANVVSFILDVESAGKQLNKAFLESASAADALVNTVGDGSVSLNASLRDIREGINDLYLSQGLGVTAEAAMAMVAEFQAAGVTLKEMKGAMTDVSDSEAAYVKVIQHMTAQQRVLGASVEDVASITERYGYSLEDIAVRFATITDQAMQSGFGVKRFYSMILQATTGMGVYNTRIEEAAFFATRLGKILGSRGLEQSGLLQKLSQGFKGQGVKENYKAMMMMGDKARKEIFSQEYEARVGNVNRSKGQKGLLAKAIETAGLGGKIDMSNLSESLKKVNVEERSRLLAAIRQQDGGSDMAVGLAKEISQILQLHVGTQGRSGGAVSAGALGMSGFLKAQQAMMKRFGLNDVRQLNTDSKASIVYRSFLEEQMGYNGEQTDAFIAAIDGLRGDFDLLKREGPAKTEEKMVAQVRKYGAYINKQGNLIQAQVDSTGKIIEGSRKDLGKADFDAFMRLNEGVLTKATEQRDRNLELSEQIANNTVDIAQRIEMGVTYFLQGIYNTLDSILNFFIGGNLDADGKKRAQELYDAYDKGIKTLEEKIEQTRKAEAEAAKDKDLNPEEKQAKLRGLKARREEYERGLGRIRAGKDDLRQRIANKDDATIEDLNQGMFNKVETTIPDLDKIIQGQVESAEVFAGKAEEEAKETKAIRKTGEQSLETQTSQLETLRKMLANDDLDRMIDYLTGEGYSAKDAISALEHMGEMRSYKEAGKNGSGKFLRTDLERDLVKAGHLKPPAEDFLYQGDGFGNGVVTPINSFDRAMGVMYGKPNGMFDRAGRFGGGRGYASNVIININGDPITVTRTVRKVLAAERSRGLGGGGRTSSLYT